MSTLKGATMHRRCHHIGACWDLLVCLWIEWYHQSMCTVYAKKLFTLLYEIHIYGSPCCSTREDFSIDVSITNLGLILTKLWWFLFSGYGQTDRHGFEILIWKHVDTRKISTQSSKLVVSCRSLYASPEDGDA